VEERGPILRLGGEWGWGLSDRADQTRPSSLCMWEERCRRHILLSPTSGPYFLVALILSPDLFICAKELFLEAKLPGLDQCATMERPAVRPSAARGRAFCGGLRVSLLSNCRCHMRCSGP
jgi:hypothetical protein